MSDSYKKVLAAIVSDKYDPAAISLRLAQEYPDIFLELFDEKGTDLRETVIELLRTGLFVGAVKFCRDFTGANLRDAKAYVDAVRDELRAKSLSLEYGKDDYEFLKSEHPEAEIEIFIGDASLFYGNVRQLRSDTVNPDDYTEAVYYRFLKG